MTMQELSGQYAGTAEVLYQRIAELRKQAAAAADPDYDRSYRVYAYYRI